MKNFERGVMENSSIFFNTPSNIAKSTFFYPECMGHFFCNELYKVSRNYYDSFLLMYIKSGKAFIEYEEKSYVAKSGDIVILDCKKPHSYGSIGRLETLWLHFDGNSSSSFFQLLNDRLGCTITVKDEVVFLKILSSIIDSYEKNAPLPEVTISYHIHKMLAELLLVSSQKESVPNHDDMVNEVLDFIKKNFHKKILLGDLAKVACLSQFHLSRVFKIKTGYSPYEYIMMIRMNHAKHLLKSSDLQIKDIAFQSGFNSESNFTVAFKTQIGITPREFRGLSF